LEQLMRLFINESSTLGMTRGRTLPSRAIAEQKQFFRGEIPGV
jgi:hypothetical protein